MGGVEYQVTKVDPTDPQTKGAVYQVHKVSEEIAATLGGKVYRARIIKDPTEPTVAGKVYQIVLIDDPDDPSVKGKVYNAILTGGSEAVVVGPGTSPLVLPDAIANSLSYVKAFGGTEQNGTPTPDAPIDIVSNNGVLKVRHASGLPLGYTLLDYITFGGAQYIDTGLAINNNTRVLFDVKRSTSSAQPNYPWLGGVRDYVNNTNINKKTLEFSKSDSTKLYLQYATSGEISLTVPDTTQRHTYDFDKNKLYVDENLIYTATQETFMGNLTFLIGTVYSQGSVSKNSMFYGGVYGFKLWQDGTNLSMDLIPAKRDSDNVVGMYDIVSGQFFTNAGIGDFTAGTAVSDPVEIYTDGLVETINVHGKNLFDKDSATVLNLYGTTDNPLAYRADRYGVYIPVEPSTKYAISRIGTLYLNLFETASVPAVGVATTQYTAMGTASTQTITTAATTKYLYIYSAGTGFISSLQIEKGAVATDYQPYYDGGTATAEMLLKVGDYQDVQSIIDGVVTRKIGVKVLDGTETGWTKLSGANYVSLPKTTISNMVSGTDATCLSSNFVQVPHSGISLSEECFSVGASYVNFKKAGDPTVAQFTQWVADQYAAGTPVIIVYPLATPTTESVAGQTLQVTDGDNVLEITQASLDNLELEAEYEKEAE